MGVPMLTGFGLNRAFAEAGISGNAPAGQSDLSPQDKTSDSKPTDSGPPITQAQIDHPKTIKIPGQNKCQTLDGFSASEPCPSGGSHHHSKHSTHNSGTTDTSSTTIPTTSGTSSSGEFIQLSTNRSDFSNGDDVNSIRLVFVHGGNSPIGGWLLAGTVQNVGNKTIPMLTLIATIYSGYHGSN